MPGYLYFPFIKVTISTIEDHLGSFFQFRMVLGDQTQLRTEDFMKLACALEEMM